jgi:hypothetical protein
MTYGNLLFRRQFLLTPDICADLNHWQYRSVGYFHLYAHPDLQLSVVSAADSNVTLTLLGYIIDPNYPERLNTDILDEITKFADSIEKIGDYLCSITGRFVLIVKTPKDILLFHDPCGLRTVCYTEYKEKAYVGSQPYILKQVIPLEDGKRLSSYNRSLYAQTVLEHWIPSGCTLFEKVYHLIPNHYLRLSTLDQVRYWPKRIIPRKRVNEVVTEASELLQKLMIAANERFKLALTITAGWDTRMLLAASKSISDEIYFYTLQVRDLNAKSHDIAIPAKLLQSLGLKHNLLNCNKPVPEAFRKIYIQNSSPAHVNDWGKMVYGMIDTYPQDRITVKGSCNEIARCFYYKYGVHAPIVSPDRIIALVSGWDAIMFAREQIHTWYNRACEVATEAKIDILDLFYWEHRMGSWQAQSQLEFDIVQEAFTPFNHRRLLELMLCTPPKLRSAPYYILSKRMNKVMWPEIMSQPINPMTQKERLAHILRRMRAKAMNRIVIILGQIGVYEITRKIFRKVIRKNA